MKIKILSLRKSDSRNIQVIESDYLKRLKKYTSVELIDIKRSKINDLSLRGYKKDTQKILSYLSKDTYSVLLSDDGREFSSCEFAKFIKTCMHKGIRTMIFIIGGPTGLSKEIKEKVHYKMSLSRMTFPHRLARLILIEALYRSFDIIHGGPYNK